MLGVDRRRIVGMTVAGVNAELEVRSEEWERKGCGSQGWVVEGGGRCLLLPRRWQAVASGGGEM
jgi:hypothetical protein